MKDAGKALLVASTGGHLAQLVRLEGGLGLSHDSVYLTFRSPQSESLLRGRRVVHAPYIRPRGFVAIVRTAFIVFKLFRAEKFDSCVSTGAGIALAAIPLAKVLGLSTLYIESVSRTSGPSLTGRIIALLRVADLRTQHRTWETNRWKYRGDVLDVYESYATSSSTNEPSVFVSLGTIRPYRFDSLVDAVLTSGIANSSTAWQLGCTDRSGLPGVSHKQIDAKEFEALALQADVVITHAGVGTILQLLEMGKYPIVVVRRRARKEHVDDHQEQISELLSRHNLARVVEAPDLSVEDIHLVRARRVRKSSSV